MDIDTFLSESCAKPTWVMIHKDEVHYFNGLQEMIDKKGLQPDEGGFYLLENIQIKNSTSDGVTARLKRKK